MHAAAQTGLILSDSRLEVICAPSNVSSFWNVRELSFQVFDTQDANITVNDLSLTFAYPNPDFS